MTSSLRDCFFLFGSCHIADHIQIIFAGFVEQSKTSTSVLHMSSLFHAFTLCQLWSVYLEQISYLSAPTSEAHNITMGILIEFWGKVTPCILSLVSSSKVVCIFKKGLQILKSNKNNFFTA